MKLAMYIIFLYSTHNNYSYCTSSPVGEGECSVAVADEAESDAIEGYTILCTCYMNDHSLSGSANHASIRSSLQGPDATSGLTEQVSHCVAVFASQV